jgi:hypothetical protein
MKRTLLLILLLAILILMPLLSSEALANIIGLSSSFADLLNEPAGMLFVGVGLLLTAGFIRGRVIPK